MKKHSPTQVQHSPRSVALNTVLILATQVVARLFGFIIALLLANYLGVSVFGSYSYAIALVSLLMPLADMGMDIYLMKLLPNARSGEQGPLIATVLLSKMGFALGILVLTALLASLLEGFLTPMFSIILLAGLYLTLRTYWQTFSSTFRALNRVDTEAVFATGLRLAELVVLVILLWFRPSLNQILLVLSLVNGGILGLTTLYLHRSVVAIRLVNIRAHFQQLFRGGLPFALNSVLVAIYFNVDTVLLTHFINAEAAGIYRAAYNLIIPLIMVTTALSSAIFPYVSQNFSTRFPQVQKTIRMAVSLLILIALPIALLTTMLADEIIQFLYKPEYRASAECLRLLVWFLPVVYLTNLAGHILGACDRQPYVLRVGIINTVFNVGANLIFIPWLGAIGAALTTVFTETIGLLLLLRVVKQLFPNLLDRRVLPKIGFALLASALVVWLLPAWHVLFQLAIAIAVYALMLMALKTISYQDLLQFLPLRNRL